MSAILTKFLFVTFLIVNKSKVQMTIMRIKIKKRSFPIHTWNNIFILIVYGNTRDFLVSSNSKPLFLNCVVVKNVCNLLFDYLWYRKIYISNWKDQSSLHMTKDSVYLGFFFPYLEKIILIRLKVNRIDMLPLSLITIDFLSITFLYRLIVRHNRLL